LTITLDPLERHVALRRREDADLAASRKLDCFSGPLPSTSSVGIGPFVTKVLPAFSPSSQLRIVSGPFVFT